MFEHRTKPPLLALTPEMAQNDPTTFKALALETLEAKSVLGAQLWKFGMESGIIHPNRVSLDTTTWVSRSGAQGDIVLGTQPIDRATKDRAMFHGERFTYPEEVSYKLLHEAAHSFLFLVHGLEEVEPLRRAASGIREQSGGERGLTALGSLEFYRGENKVTEDTVELMTMYAWDPAYMAEFAVFLTDPQRADVRSKVGLVTLGDSRIIYDLVSQAVDGALAS